MNKKEVKNKIKKRGYWRVVVRPAPQYFDKERIEKNELEDVINESQVRLRGWYYPHINEKQPPKITGANKVSNVCSFIERGHLEYWEFTTSGQFGHIFAMKEDYMIDGEKAQKIKSDFRFNNEKIKEVDKFFEVVSALYKITEIYYFASNLAQTKKFKDVGEFEIKIELKDVKSRLLYIWQPLRDLFKPYICQREGGSIFLEDKVSSKDLIAKHDKYSLKMAIKLFQEFNWKDPSGGVLKNDQDKILKLKND